MREVLARTLPAAGAEDALALWQMEFSNLPGFGVVRFVQELGRRHGLTDSQRRDLRLALFREIYAVISGGASREAAVETHAPGNGGRSAPSSAGRSAAARVAGAMLAALAESAGRDHLAEFTDLFREHASDALLPENVAVKAQAWDATGGEPPLLEADSDTLGRLIHAAYNALCDTVGPARADRGLAHAVQRAEMLDAARDVPPRSLL
jgi:hypothetical protein